MKQKYKLKISDQMLDTITHCKMQIRRRKTLKHNKLRKNPRFNK
jgi:hypothetical protein